MDITKFNKNHSKRMIRLRKENALISTLIRDNIVAATEEEMNEITERIVNGIPEKDAK